MGRRYLLGPNVWGRRRGGSLVWIVNLYQRSLPKAWSLSAQVFPISHRPEFFGSPLAVEDSNSYSSIHIASRRAKILSLFLMSFPQTLRSPLPLQVISWIVNLFQGSLLVAQSLSVQVFPVFHRPIFFMTLAMVTCSGSQIISRRAKCGDILFVI